MVSRLSDIFQPYLAKKDVLRSFIFLTPRPPSNLGYINSVSGYSYNGVRVHVRIILFIVIPKEVRLILSMSLQIYLGNLKQLITY